MNPFIMWRWDGIGKFKRVRLLASRVVNEITCCMALGALQNIAGSYDPHDPHEN